MTPRKHAVQALLSITLSRSSTNDDAACIEAAIRAAAEPLVEALRAMLGPPSDDAPCSFGPQCEVCSARAALAAWEAK